MTIAVLMSTFNGEKYLTEQIDSILQQEGDFKIQLTVRDDGSTDATQEILDRYQTKGFLKWYQGKNVGPALSFMDLILNAGDYEYYAFADQDDVWKPNKIEKAVKALHTNGSSKKPMLYCSNALLVDSNLKTLGRNVYKNYPKTDIATLSCAGGLLGCTMVYNQALQSVLVSGERPKTSEIIMHDFYIALVCAGIGGKLIYEDYPSLKYRQHGNNAIGVNHGFVQTLKSRIRDIFHEEKISIATQAGTVLRIYREGCLLPQNIEWLEALAHYRESLITRIRLAVSMKTKYISYNMSIRLRAEILLSNR